MKPAVRLSRGPRSQALFEHAARAASLERREKISTRMTEPFSRTDERFYARLAVEAGSRLAPRQVWRAKHARPHLETGRAAEVKERIWLIPSTRHEGLVYRVDLKTGACCSLPGGEVCPDKENRGKVRCVHAEAAILAEQHWLADMRGGEIAREMERRG